jgi:hypothetical protein
MPDGRIPAGHASRPTSGTPQETYSHVAAEVEHRLLEALNDRWDKAVADSPEQPAWRI